VKNFRTTLYDPLSYTSPTFHSYFDHNKRGTDSGELHCAREALAQGAVGIRV
jgi:hypothetical protein